MYLKISPSFKPFKLFLLIVVIDINFVLIIGATDDPYNDFVLDSQRPYGDLETSLPIGEQCTSGVHCNLLNRSIRVLVDLLNEFKTASKQHCAYPRETKATSSKKISRQIDSRTQQRKRRKPTISGSSKTSNNVKFTQPLRQREGSHLSRRQLFHHFPRAQYSFGPTDETYNNHRPIETFSESRLPSIKQKSAIDTSNTLDNLFSSDGLRSDEKKNKKKSKKKHCSRHSSKKKESIEPKRRILEDATITKPENVTNIISVNVTSPISENNTVTIKPEAKIDRTDRI